MNKFTPYNELQALLDNPTTLYLESIREFNPNYESLDNLELYNELRSTGRLDKRYHNSDIDKSFGYTVKDKIQEDDRSFREKYQDLNAFGRTIEFIGDLVPEWEWAQRAYNQSLTGVARTALLGEEKFKFDPEEDIGTVEDIVSMAASFLMPLDILTLGIGGKVGSVVTAGTKGFGKKRAFRFNGLNQQMQKRLGQKITESGLEGLTVMPRLASGAIKGAFPLASYEGAMGYTHALANNKDPNNKKMDEWAEMGLGVIRGGILGTLTGGASTGLLGRRATLTKQAGKPRPDKEFLSKLPWYDKLAWKASSTPGLVGVESAIFSSGTTVDKIYNGEDITAYEMFREFVKNYALFSTIKAQHKVFDKAYESAATIRKVLELKGKDNRMEKVLDEYRSKYDVNEIGKEFNNIVKELEGMGVKNAENVADIMKKAEYIMEDVVYVRDSMAKGRKHFEGDTIALQKIVQLKDFVAELKELSQKVDFGDSVREKSLQKEMNKEIERLEELSTLYSDNVKNPMEQGFKDFLDGGAPKEQQRRDEVLTEIKLRHKQQFPQSKKDPSVIIGGKEVPISDPRVTLEQLESYRKIQQRVKTEDKTEVDINEILNLSKERDKEFKEAKDVDPLGQEALDRPLLVRMYEAMKNPFSKTKQKAMDAFDRNAKWIKSIIQNDYSSRLGYRTGETIEAKNIQTKVNQLKAFSEYLANKGLTFETMKARDVITYAKQSPFGHKTAMSDLLSTLRTVEQVRPRTIDPSLITMKTKDVMDAFKAKKMTARERAERIALRVKNIFISKGKNTDGYFRIDESKQGAKDAKEVPITASFVSAIKKVKENFKDYLTKDSSVIYRDKDGIVFDKADLNAFVANVMGGFKKSGKGRVSASILRSTLQTWAKNQGIKKMFGETVDVLDFVDRIGLGHTGASSTKEIYVKHGKNKSKKIYMQILKDFYKDLANYKEIKKQGGGVKEEGIYNIVEIGEGFNKILSMKENQTIKIEVKDAKGKVDRTFEINKYTAEALMRHLIEVPSRLNEVVLESRKEAEALESRLQILEKKLKMDREKLDLEIDSMERNGEFDGLNKYERLKLVEKRQQQKLEKQKLEQEFKKSEEYKRREVINKRIKDKDGPERELEELLSGDIDTPLPKNTKTRIKRKKGDLYRYEKINKVIRDIRLKVFGHVKYNIKDKDMGVDSFQLEIYERALNEAIENVKNPSQFERNLEVKGINETQKSQIAKLMGSKDGRLASLDPVNKSRITQLTKNIEPVYEKHTDARDIQNQEPNNLWGLKNKMRKGNELFTTTWVLIKKIAEKSSGNVKKYLQDIESYTSRIDVTNEIFRGKANYEMNLITEILKSGNKKEAIKDIVWLDSNMMRRLRDASNNRNLTKEERAAHRALYEKMLPHYKASNISGTAEHTAKAVWSASRTRLWNEFSGSILKANQGIPPAQYKRLEKMLEKMFEADYLPSYITKEARDNYRESKEYRELKEKSYEEILANKVMVEADKLFFTKSSNKRKGITRSTELSDKLLNKEYGASYKKLLKEFKEKDTKKAISVRREARNEASEKVLDGIEHAELHVKSKNFMKRGNQLPMFITITKNGKEKLIRTYESGMYNVLNPYYLSTSRFLSVARVAPEFLGSKFYKKKGGELKTALERVLTSETKGDKATYNYLNDVVMDLIGTKESNSWKLTSDIANFSAMSGLSGFATPGFKNLLLGQVQSFTTFSGMEYFNTFRKLIFKRKYYKESMDRATKLGAAQYTQRELSVVTETRKNKKGEVVPTVSKARLASAIGDSVYKFSFMTKAENFNRMVAIETGANFANHQFEILSSKTSTPNQKIEAEAYLRDVLRFTEKEVNFIKENKHNDIGNAEYMKEFNYLMDKVQVYSHKATQGGVGVLDVPKWMSESPAKDFLVFQRIATSVTTNVVNSVVKPALRGNFMPLVKYGVANYLSGAAMYGAYKVLFDDDSPRSLGSEFDKALMYLWRSEAAGIFGMFLDNLPVGLNPYYNGVSSGDITKNMMPVILRNGKELLSAVVAASGKYKSVGQATHDLAKNTIVLYGQADKLVSRQGMGDDSEVFKDGKNAANYKRQYEQEIGVDSPNFLNIEGSKNQPYYRDLKSAIYWGTEEDIAKHYFLAVNYLESYYMKTDKGITPVGAFNKAHESVMSSIDQMNPTYSTKTRDRKSTSRKDYLDYLAGKSKDAYQTVLRVEKRFKLNKNLIKKIRGNELYINRFSSTPDLNYNKTSGSNKNRSGIYRDYKYLDEFKRHPSYYELRQMELYDKYYDF